MKHQSVKFIYVCLILLEAAITMRGVQAYHMGDKPLMYILAVIGVIVGGLLGILFNEHDRKLK